MEQIQLKHELEEMTTLVQIMCELVVLLKA